MSCTLVADAIASLRPSATEEIENTVKRMQLEGVTDLVSLGVGEPCFDTPINIKRAAIDALMKGETKYQPTAGSYALREQIAGKLQRENGINANANDVIVTAGGKFGIYLAMQATLQAGNTALVIEPAWVTYEPSITLTGATVIKVVAREQDGYQPDPDAVRRALTPTTRMIVVNSPCNPTGAVIEPAVLREIAKIAQNQDALLLSDEVYEYQVFEGRHYSPGSEFDNVVTVNAFSKSFAMTGWRLGYVTGPQPVLNGMIKIYQHSTSSVTSFTQNGGIEALQNAESRRAADEMCEGYRRRRSLMLDLIRKCRWLELPTTPSGAFYCFPSYRANVPSVALSQALLHEVHVATVPGSAFGDCGEGHIRLSYSAEPGDISEAFRRIDAFFEGHQAQ